MDNPMTCIPSPLLFFLKIMNDILSDDFELRDPLVPKTF